MNPAIRRTQMPGRKPLSRAPRRLADAVIALPAAIAMLAGLANAGTAHAAPRAAPIPGGIAIVRLASAEAPAPQAFYMGRPVLVERRDGAWRALVGIALNAEPGEQRLKVVTAGAAGVAERETAFRVMPHTYATQKLTIRDTTKGCDHSWVRKPETMATTVDQVLPLLGAKTKGSRAALIDCSM